MKKLFFMGFALLLCAMWPADAAAQLKIGGRKLNTGNCSKRERTWPKP